MTPPAVSSRESVWRERRLLRSAIALAVFLGVCFATAAIGSVSTASSLDPWYESLRKPAFTPPGALIGVVWSILYALMAFAGWIAWRERGLRGNALPFVLFALQLALNAAWSMLFFGLRRPGLAFVDILLLEAAIVATLVAFWRVRPLAGALLVPYVAWVGFASYLNLALWRLNA